MSSGFRPARISAILLAAVRSRCGCAASVRSAQLPRQTPERPPARGIHLTRLVPAAPLPRKAAGRLRLLLAPSPRPRRRPSEALRAAHRRLRTRFPGLHRNLPCALFRRFLQSLRDARSAAGVKGALWSAPWSRNRREAHRPEPSWPPCHWLPGPLPLDVRPRSGKGTLTDGAHEK